MTLDQGILFALLLVVFGLLIWGRWRYDLVAFGALLVALIAGVVPRADAFSGFGHPATVIIAIVLIVSRGLSNSGVIEWLARQVIDSSRKLSAHIGIMSTLAATLSAVMNNVAALALLMPVDLQAAAKAGRSPSLSLMALSFASILGGMVTLIGTPPNIVIAEFRNDAFGESFKMFDFAPVGIACAAVGVAYVALIGWRLLPAGRKSGMSDSESFDLDDYVAEVRVSEGSKIIGQRVRDLDEATAAVDIEIIGLIRNGKRFPGLARVIEIEAGDILVIEATPGSLEEALGTLKLEYVTTGSKSFEKEDLAFAEVVVTETSSLVMRSAAKARLQYRYGVALVGVSRKGKRFRENLHKLILQPGDVLLLLGPDERLSDTTVRLGVLPLADRGQRVIQRDKALVAVGAFAAAIVGASLGVVYLPVALGMVAALYVFLNIVPLRELYDSVEWSVIILLGSLIPIGSALESTGGATLIADGLLQLSAGLPAAAVLALLVIVTMTLSDIMNNTATAVMAAPVAVEIADRLKVNPDAFLMGVAVAASCAFLTPIGHKNNTLIMGPGGYRFGDYWRMGLPLEILIVIVSVPAILIVWPL